MEWAWLLITMLLLPAAYVCGWWVAQRAASRQGGAGIADDYFKGLNYVLNEQPDKAIEVFTGMLEIDSETVETHLALGNLFRRRGEVDRAIRIHQNLIARPTLSREQRTQSLLELGMDYMRSGLLDRAESLFQRLVESEKYAPQALRGLLSIYQQERDWPNAIAVAQRLEASSDDHLGPIIAHYYCELSIENADQGNHKEAKKCLQRALNVDPKCVRAGLMEAAAARRAGRTRLAIRLYGRVEKQDPDYLPEIILPLLECYKAQNRLPTFMRYLQEILQGQGGMTALLCLTSLIAETQGEAQAVKFISAQLQQRPSVRGVDKLLEYALTNTQGEIRHSLLAIRDLMASLLKDRAIYQCIQCGFDARELNWQCPGCKNWNTVKPISGAAGE